jgi:hypothetical protein
MHSESISSNGILELSAREIRGGVASGLPRRYVDRHLNHCVYPESSAVEAVVMCKKPCENNWQRIWSFITMR